MVDEHAWKKSHMGMVDEHAWKKKVAWGWGMVMVGYAKIGNRGIIYIGW
jgi:hypothetical protein